MTEKTGTGEGDAERTRSDAGLQLEHLELSRFLENARFAIVAYMGPEHVVQFSNPKHDEMTGGRIVLGRQSTPGAGAEFTVSLPWRSTLQAEAGGRDPTDGH